MKTPHVDILSEKYSEKSESIRRRRDMLVGHVGTTVSGLDNAVISTPGTVVTSVSERVRDVAGDEC